MRSRLFNLSLMGCALVALFIAGRGNSMTIVDYYNLLSPENLSHQKYTLVQRDGKWTVRETPDYGAVSVPVVDVRNGYIRTVYHGGDGEDERVVALFLAKDRTPLIGIYSSYNGTGGEYGIAFLEYRNRAWKDVTARVLPTMSYRDFLRKGFDTAPFEGVMKRVNGGGGRFIEPQFIVTLPRHGTVVTVALHLKALRGADVTDADLEVVEKVRSGQAIKVIELNWNMEKGVFEIGKKR
ncbi:MAG: hypothetical protein JW838_02555 [Spirochaetes bacterium]|nr:hypothetical protein [Spirochaetota bacterium]